MGRKSVVSVIAVGVLLVAPTPAPAQTCVAPPGTAGTDQYCEALPTPEGTNGATGGGLQPTLPRLEDILSPRDISLLEEAGAEGEALLALPAPSASEPPQDDERLGADLEGLLEDNLAEEAVIQGPVGAIADAAAAGAGLSPLLRWALVGSLLGIAAAAWLSYVRRTLS